MCSSDLAQLEEVPDVGPVVAGHVYAFFHEQHNRDIVEALRDCGVRWHVPEEQGGPKPLEGQVWVLTGALSMPRTRARALLESLGAKVTGSVSAKTTVLLAGADSGSKLAKAERLRVDVVDEDAFIELLEQHGLRPD